MQTGSVKDLSSQRAVSSVVVRLAQVWENWNKNKELYELGLLFIDKQGNVIEGCVSKDRIVTFRKKLKEDLVYKIQYFLLTGQKSKHRVVDHPHRIKLGKCTRITEITSDLADFPFYAYNIKSFDELEKRIGGNTYVSDVIGVAIRQTDVIPSRNDQDSRRQIRMKNESGKLAIVTLWGKHAEEFDAQFLYEQSIDQNMIVLFTGVTVSYFQSLVAFGSTSLTRWHFSPPVPEAEPLHNSIKDQHYIVEWDGHDTSATKPTATTLYALGNEDPENIITKKFKLNILITQVHELQNWWFHSCKDCRKGMAPYGNTRKCPRCGKTESQQRYKLCVDAIDIEANDEHKIVNGRFMFYGDEAAAIIGKDLALLLAQARGRPNFTPPTITAIVGKKCAVTAKVKDDMYDVDEEGLIVLDVSKAELIKQTMLTEASTSQLNPSINEEWVRTGLPADNINTPAKDVVEQPAVDTEEDSFTLADSRKRKSNTSTSIRSTKKSASGNKEGPAARKLGFDSDQ